MSTSKKLKIAFFDFTGCEGCQLTVIDTLQINPQLLDVVEFVQFREAMSEKGEDYEVAFIEGSYTRPTDESRLKAIRDQAEIVIALGACAHLGGVNALRNRQSSIEVHHMVYGRDSKAYGNQKAMPISAVIPVDYTIPGCPIDRQEFIRVIQALVQHQLPRLPDYALCAECKMQENVCLFKLGVPCLGPVTRAGCGAICPTFGIGCEGCRGLVSEPNLAWLRVGALEQGIGIERFDAAARLFLTNTLVESEGDGYGWH
jgi:sulfhydrogenase subunit delta